MKDVLRVAAFFLGVLVGRDLAEGSMSDVQIGEVRAA